MLRGLFVDRHYYRSDHEGRGRWETFTRSAQIRLAVLGLSVVTLSAMLVAAMAYGWIATYGSSQLALVSQPIARQVTQPEPATLVARDEVEALRAALEETRTKRAELAAELESLKRQQVATPDTGPQQADLDALQQRYDEAVQRAEEAESATVEANLQADLARQEASARTPIDEASIPDRIRSLELELEMARAAIPAAPETGMGDAEDGEVDLLDLAFSPKEEELARRIRELEATVAELEAERNVLEERLAQAGGQASSDAPSEPPAMDGQPADPAEPPATP